LRDNPPSPWSRRTQDAWFFGALALSAVGAAYLFSSFLYVLMFACVVVVVSWPAYQRLLALWEGRRALAALSTVLLLVVVVFGPLGYFGYLSVKHAAAMVQSAGEMLQSGQVARWMDESTFDFAWIPPWLRAYLPEDLGLQEMLAGPLQENSLFLVNGLGAFLPGLLTGTLGMGIDLVIFVFAIITLYMEGPRVLQVLKNLSPMDDAYEDRLFAVFGELANNLVMGSLATAAIQGTVAGIGYQIAGVDRVVFFAMLTGVCALVPFVGTVLVWVPLSIVVGLEHGLGWGVFLAGWGVGVAHIDNFTRPLFMRGSTQIHPLLIFLAVFGGISWLGLAGALIGPVMVAGFIALYTIYAHDYLGQPVSVLLPREEPGWLARRVQGLAGRGQRLLEAPAPDAPRPLRAPAVISASRTEP
jgi:predicted PurR-regulated permease PerM